MRAAGYSESVAAKRGSIMLRDPETQVLLALEREKLSVQTWVTAERLVSALVAMASFDIRTVIQLNPVTKELELVPMDEWPPEAVLSVQGISKTKNGWSVRTVDKAFAIDKLMRHLGAYKDADEDAAKQTFNLVMVEPSRLRELARMKRSE
jgi:phage terminase small subunit